MYIVCVFIELHFRSTFRSGCTKDKDFKSPNWMHCFEKFQSIILLKCKMQKSHLKMNNFRKRNSLTKYFLKKAFIVSINCVSFMKTEVYFSKKYNFSSNFFSKNEKFRWIIMSQNVDVIPREIFHLLEMSVY